MSDWIGFGQRVEDIDLWIENFREHFPEFAHAMPENFTDEQITFWYMFGDKLLTEDRWFTIYNEALELFVAHNLLIEKNQQLAFAAGNFTGTPLGNISNKSVGDVSVGYDLSSFMEERGGEWNLTTYGRRFIFFVRLVGTGGAYV